MKAYIEYPVGQMTDLTEFPLGAQVKVQVTNANGLFNIQMAIAFDNPDVSPVYMNTTATIMGNCWFEFTMPTEVTRGTIIITEQGYWPVPTLTYKINIGVGEPAAVTGSQGDNTPDIWKELETIAKWVAIGTGVIAVAWVASKAAPSIAQGITGAKSKSRS